MQQAMLLDMYCVIHLFVTILPHFVPAFDDSDPFY